MRRGAAQQRLIVSLCVMVLVLAVALPAAAQTVNTFAITYGDAISNGIPGPGAGNIEVGGAQDVYTFQSQTGDEVIFDSVTGNIGAFRWVLTAPDGTVVFNTFNADRRVALSQTGTHTLTVTGNTVTTTGIYSFRLLLVPPPQQFAISIGDTVSNGVPAAGAGNVEMPGAADLYTFSSLAGQGVIFDALVGNTALFRVILTAPDGTVLFNTFYVDQQAQLPLTGIYILRVEGLQVTSTGAYSFRLLEVPAPQGFTISVGDTISNGVPSVGAGNIEVPGAVDIYAFDGLAGQSVIFDALTGNPALFRAVLTAPDGTQVFSVFYVDQQVTLPQTGTYHLTVGGLNIASVGIYSFRLLNVPPAPQEFAITIGDSVSDGVPAPGAGNLEVPGAVDVYHFDGTAGQEVIFDTLTGHPARFRVTLTAPDGTQVFSDFYVDQQLILPQTGTYSLKVSGLFIADFGAYSFALLPVITNTAPAASDDSATTDEDTAITIAVLLNDTDPDGDTLVVASLTQPLGGIVGHNGTDVTYTPNADFNGTDVCTYTVSDGNGGLDTATVMITVLPVNDDPAANEDAAITDEDAAISVGVLANDADVEGDTLVVSSVTQPLNGMVTNNGMDVTYKPYPDFYGVDTFEYTVSDSSGGSDTATVTITVNPVNDAPVIENPGDQVNVEGEAVSLTVLASDPDADPLIFSATGLPDGLSIDPSTGTISGSIVPGASLTSPYHVVVTASDPGGLLASAAFVWTVKPVMVAIDIKPGEEPSCINNNGHGVIPVAIFGSATFDVSQVDAATIRFEGQPVRAVGSGSRLLAHFEDVNGDGFTDLVVQIQNIAGAFSANQMVATLTARLSDGRSIMGSDNICLVP